MLSIKSAYSLACTLTLAMPAPASALPTLLDQNGYSITLPAKVRKVVAIPIPMASMVMVIDGSVERLSGINSAARSDISEGLLGRMFPAARTIPAQVAGESFAPNIEALAASRPDLVIQWGDRGKAIIEPMHALGMPVLTLRYGDSLLAADWLRLTGTALGKPARGEYLAQWFETRLAELARLGAAVPVSERPKVLYLMGTRSSLRVAGKGTSMDGDIRRAGGINPAANLPGVSQVNVEQILAWNPDIILLNNFEAGLTPQTLFTDSRFSGTKALRDKRVYLYPRGGFRWDPPSQETPLSIEWLYDVFHPTRTGTDLRTHIKSAYLDLYDYRISRAEIDKVLRLSENAHSAHYLKRFAEEAR